MEPAAALLMPLRKQQRPTGPASLITPSIPCITVVVRGVKGGGVIPVLNAVCFSMMWTHLLEEMYSADVVVFSSPIYFGDTCGQFKLFYDRMYSLINTDQANDADNSSRLPPGKVAVLILAHVERAGVYNDVQERYTDYLEIYGFEVHSIIAGGLPLPSNSDIDEHLEAASKLARELIRAE